ncbi:diguanylate cyclase [Aquitalea sp. S1-19]|nr:diguanylate cyclase [Aquitalea sp. S1-19]
MRLDYRTLPVRMKLQLIGLSTLAVCILLSTLLLIANDYRTSLAFMQQGLQTQARIIADNSAAALRFDDVKAAEETLAALRASPMIHSAEILEQDGELFAAYPDQATVAAGREHLLGNSTLQLREKIMQRDQVLGELVIHFHLTRFYQAMLGKAGAGVLLALLAMVTAFLMLRRLLVDIADPITQLSVLMAKVAADQDYSLRSSVVRADELGALAQGLDTMLSHIERYRSDELHRAEAKLSESENRYNTLVESVPVGVVQLERDGSLAFANRMFWHIAGQPPGLYAGESVLAFVHPDDRAALFALFRSVMSGQPVAELAFRLQGAGGTRWVALEFNALRGLDGRVQGAVGTLLDITERRHNETQLRLAASVFEASHEAIMITDADGRIVSTNRAFTRINEYAVDEVAGLTPAVLSAGSTLPEVYRDMWQKLAHEGAWSGELLNRRKSGATYTAWVSIAAVCDGNGQTSNYIGISRDITGIKEENDRIAYLAHYDGLTGLPNRTLFYDRARVELARAQRDGLGFAVVFIDLDRFKWVNDTLGHAVGDALLREVACRLEAGVRASDTVSRFGGDEFVLLLCAVQVEEAAAIADKLLAEVGGEAICGGHALYITPSIGLSLWSPQTPDLESLIREADEAMYLAKRGGRNKVCIYEHGVPA